MAEQHQMERDLNELKKLMSSRGWAIVQESLERDCVQAAFAFADNVLMTEKEIDFRRGAIHAARALTTVPQRLAMKIENELLLASADAEASTTMRHATA